MVYTEAEIFREAAADRKRLLKWDARKYKEVWLAFCKWIVERFDQGKGVNIINFMSLSWEPDEIEQEIYGEGVDKALRPVWRLNAAFERGYNLQCKNKSDKRSPNDEVNFEKMEEINFHKIAMRYSNTLTKDVTFSCLREMFSRVGKAMMTGQHVKVFCGVGDFICRDRQTEFEFDSHYHRFIIRKFPGAAPGETTHRVVPIHSSPGADSPVQSASKSGGDILIIGGEGREGGERKGYEERLLDGRGQTIQEAMNLKSQTRNALDNDEEEQLEHQGTIREVYNGTANDESWRLERAKRQGGGDKQKHAVGQMLLQKEASALEKTANVEVRNVLLGEQRRVEASKQAEASIQAKRLEAIQKTAPLMKKALLDAEAARKAAEHEEKLEGLREDPFFIHLEADPVKVFQEKKIAQNEESERLHTDKMKMELAEVTLHRSLESEYAKKRSEALRLKQEWAQQMEHKTKAKSLARLPDICVLDDKSVQEKLAKLKLI